MVLVELQPEQLSAGKSHETGAAVWFGRFDERVLQSQLELLYASFVVLAGRLIFVARPPFYWGPRTSLSRKRS